MIDCYHSDHTQFEKNIEKELKISLTFFGVWKDSIKKICVIFGFFCLKLPFSLSLSLSCLSQRKWNAHQSDNTSSTNLFSNQYKSEKKTLPLSPFVCGVCVCVTLCMITYCAKEFLCFFITKNAFWIF